jgi:hypothetical protein
VRDLLKMFNQAVERFKQEISFAFEFCSSQIGVTSIDQKKLTQELQAINNENDKLGATQGASYFSNGQRPEAQDGPKSIQDAVAASHVNHTTDPAKTVSVKGGPPTVTYGVVAAKSSNTASQASSLSSISGGRLNQVVAAKSRSSNAASQAVSRSSTAGRSNQFVAGFLSALGQSINQIKAVSTLNELAANPSSASAEQYPQVVNGPANSQNIPRKAALAGSASFSQPQVGEKTSTSSPVNPIPSNSAAMSTNPIILSRVSASITNQNERSASSVSYLS